MQQRLRRFIRQPELLSHRQITAKSLAVVAAIERYRFLPTSLLVRLIDGGQRNNHRHLQTLYHRGVVNRFALPKYGGPGEFIYYLDDPKCLATLEQAGFLSGLTDEQRWRKEQTIRHNREHDYAELHRNPDSQGRVLYVQHELMVTRFHALLELGCKKLGGKIELEQWKQGPELWHRVEVPAVSEDRYTGQLVDSGRTEFLPHRPDACFTLRFPTRPEGERQAHFLYEADRGTENTTRFKLKLRAHYHAIVKQNLNRSLEVYNVPRIRAVLTETTGMQWAHNLRETAKHPIVSPIPSPLFWFTTSQLLTNPVRDAAGRLIPQYLQQPEIIFKKIWASPVEDKFLNLSD